MSATPETYRTIIGYHGCDKRTAERVVLDGEPLVPSTNQYDWLGEGVYFWERSLRRAHTFASEQQARRKVNTPFVIGAFIRLGNCLDLTDVAATEDLAKFYAQVFEPAMASAGVPLPQNRKAGKGDMDILLRDLDCAVINAFMVACDNRAGEGQQYYQTVRGVFVEGDPAFPGSALRAKTHVQIAVRDPACILGYFLPRGYPLR